MDAINFTVEAAGLLLNATNFTNDSETQTRALLAISDSKPYTPDTSPDNPYYPRKIILHGYRANATSVQSLLLTFAAGCAVLLLATGRIANWINPRLRKAELMTIMWFVLCGMLHVFFEGYFVYSSQSELVESQNFFGQLWKEYAKSDSRYLTVNAFVRCIEILTVHIWGPLSFLTAILTTLQHPLAYPFIIIVSVGHIYGDLLYYATSLFDAEVHQLIHCRPEPIYFWGYYFAANFAWILVPAVLIYKSSRTIARAFRALSEAEKLIGQGLRDGTLVAGRVKAA